MPGEDLFNIVSETLQAETTIRLSPLELHSGITRQDRSGLAG